MAREVKASHFTLGFERQDQNNAMQRSADDEALRQKWQPAASKASGNMARSNFTIGQNKVFTGQTSANADYKTHAEGKQNEAAKTRIAMI